MNGENGRRNDGDRHPPAILMNNFLRNVVEKRDRFDSFLDEGFTVADLGCGSGYYTLHFAEVVGPGGTVYGVDTNSRAVKQLEAKMARRGIANIRTSTASSASMPHIPDGTVDFVLSNLTLCCMLDHEAAVKEMKRIMKQGAKAFVSVTRFGRKNDHKKVGHEEFDSIAAQFRIVDRHDGMAVTSTVLEKI